MSTRKLIVLALVLVALVVLAVFQHRRAGLVTPGGEGGKPLLLPRFDVNQVAGLVLKQGKQTVDIRREKGGWVVKSLYGYPADFSKLASAIRLLAELKAGQVIRGGGDYPGEFGLADKDDPLLISLSDAEGKEMAGLRLGKERTSSGGKFTRSGRGRYLRVGKGPVILVKEDLGEFRTENRDWIQKDLLKVSPGRIRSISVKTGEGSYALRKNEKGQFTLGGMKKSEQLDQHVVSRLSSSLKNLSCRTIADPAWNDQTLGMTPPARLVAETSDGFTYTVLVGDKDLSGGRAARLKAAYQPPPPPDRKKVEAELSSSPTPSASPGKEKVKEEKKARAARGEKEFQSRLEDYKKQIAEDRKKAEELKKLFQGWTYILPSYQADTLTLSREKLIKKPPPPPKSPEKKPKTPPADR